MYYYAFIDPTTYVCYDVYESEEPIIDDPYCIEIDFLDRSYIIRKKYINGEWIDTTTTDSVVVETRHISLGDVWLDDKVYELENEIDNHTHSGYASSDDLALLEDIINTKANATHTHDNYAPSTHTHDNYATVTALNTLSEEVDEKADAIHTHTDYATVDALSELSATVSGKANTSHSHNDTYYTETEINTKLASKSDISHTHTGIYDVSGAAANALLSANAYTDTEIDALSETMSTKANSSDLTSHTGNTTVHITSTERNNWNAAKTHANSAHAPSNAEENQNAFSNVVVNGTTISADTKTDTLTFVAGNNVTITPDATGDSITISSANTVYTHPTSAGNKHIPAGGSNGQILRWSADGTAVWGSDNNTTYSNATQTTSGLMSDIDKTKLDGIADGANKYVLPSAGTSLGGVKTGGDVTISSGVITVNDDSHNHIISNIDGLQSALDAKAASGHDHNSVYYTETEVDTLLSGKANTSHGTHVSYSTTVPVMDGTASVGTAGTVARSDHKHPTDTSRASQTDLDALETVVSGKANSSHTHTISNITNLQSTLDGKAASSHTHNYAGSSSAGGVATSASKLATARTISLTGDVSGSTSFDGSGNVSITTTVADDSHNHIIANVDGLQSALDGKSATSHTHTADAIVQMAEALFGTNSLGGVEYSYGSGSGKNVLTEISNMPQGLHTAYAISGTTGNPKTNESFRFLIHKTSGTIGWILAWDAQGSLFTNYQSAANTFKGWKCVYDANPSALWTGGYYMSSSNSTPQTVKPSKKLSECRNGWVLVWSDYDPDTSTKNNTDIHHDYVFKKNCAGANWSGQCMLCDIPRYMGSNANDVDTERRILKAIYIHDDRIEGSYQGAYDERNDVILRAVYEF